MLDGRCTCTPQQVHRYRSRISGPLIDRFDLRVRLKAVKSSELFDQDHGETSEVVRGRVVNAREQQRARSPTGALNADLSDAASALAAKLGGREVVFYRRLVEVASLSARGARRLLRVARTIADLECAERVGELHLSEAVAFRMADPAYDSPFDRHHQADKL
jgi:magnesium chelatase family protein